MADIQGLGKCAICYKQIAEGAPIGTPAPPATGVAHKHCVDRQQYDPNAKVSEFDSVAQFQRPKPHLLVGQSETTFKDRVAEHNARIDGPQMPPLEDGVVAAPEPAPAPRKWEPGMDLPPQRVTNWGVEPTPETQPITYTEDSVKAQLTVEVPEEGLTLTTKHVELVKTLLDAGVSADKVVDILNSL